MKKVTMNNIDFINTDLPLFLKDKNLTDIELVMDKINVYYKNKEKPFFNIETEETVFSTCLLLEFNYSESSTLIWGAFIFDDGKLRFLSLEDNNNDGYSFMERKPKDYIPLERFECLPSKREFIALIKKRLCPYVIEPKSYHRYVKSIRSAMIDALYDDEE